MINVYPLCYGESPGEECAVDCPFYESCKEEYEMRDEEDDGEEFSRPLDVGRVRF